MTAETPAPEQFAIVEIMGHHRQAGRISEVTMYGAQLLRVDVPAGDGWATEFYGGSAIYRLRICTEEVAREALKQIGDPRPLEPVGFRERPVEPARAALELRDDFGGDIDDDRPF